MRGFASGGAPLLPHCRGLVRGDAPHNGSLALSATFRAACSRGGQCPVWRESCGLASSGARARPLPPSASLLPRRRSLVRRDVLHGGSVALSTEARALRPFTRPRPLDPPFSTPSPRPCVHELHALWGSTFGTRLDHRRGAQPTSCFHAAIFAAAPSERLRVSPPPVMRAPASALYMASAGLSGPWPSHGDPSNPEATPTPARLWDAPSAHPKPPPCSSEPPVSGGRPAAPLTAQTWQHN